MSESVKDDVQLEPIDFDAEVEIEAVDDPAKPELVKFNSLAYTGGILHVNGYPRGVVVDLQTLKGTDKTRPVLLNHDLARPVGHTTEVLNDGKAIMAAGVFSYPGYDRERLIEASNNGFPNQISIGVNPRTGSIQRVMPGETVEVNGQTFTGPLDVARGATLREITFTAKGADDDTKARIAAELTKLVPKGIGVMEEICATLGLDAENLTDDQKLMVDRLMKPSEDGDVKAELAELKAELAEEKRVASIKAALADVPDLSTAKRDEILAEAIEGNWDATKAELKAIRASRSHAPAGHVPKNDINASLSAGLMICAGIPETDIVASLGGDTGEQALDYARKNSLSGLGIQGTIRAFMHSHGRHVSPGKLSSDDIQAALAFDAQLAGDIQASSFSTASLSGIFGGVARRSLLAGYGTDDPEILKICRVDSASDYRTREAYRLEWGGSSEINESGEIPLVNVSEKKFSNKLAERGRRLTLGKAQIENDDVGMITSIPREMGRLFFREINEVGFGLLAAQTSGTSTSAFFKTSRNHATGASSALGVDSLTTGTTQLETRVDGKGKVVGAKPKYLVAAPANRALAHQLYNSMYVENPAATKTVPTSNPHAGMFEPVISPFLTAAAAWYLLVDPMDVAALSVVFKNNQRLPTITRHDNKPTHTGFSFVALHDFAFGAEDNCGGFKADGA